MKLKTYLGWLLSYLDIQGVHQVNDLVWDSIWSHYFPQGVPVNTIKSFSKVNKVCSIQYSARWYFSKWIFLVCAPTFLSKASLLFSYLGVNHIINPYRKLCLGQTVMLLLSNCHSFVNLSSLEFWQSDLLTSQAVCSRFPRCLWKDGGKFCWLYLCLL